MDWDNRTEERHALTMTWEEFEREYGDRRTKESWRKKRSRLRNDPLYCMMLLEVEGIDIIDALPDHVKPVFEDIQNKEPLDVREVLAVSRQMQGIFDKVDPITTDLTVSFDTTEPIAILPISCIHLGSRYCFYEEFEDFFYEMLEVPRLYFASLGDDIDGFLPSFYSAEAVVGQLYPYEVQAAMLKAVLKEVNDREKLLFGTWSEHGGKWWETKVGKNPIKDIYMDFGVPFFDGIGRMKVQFPDLEYRIIAGHGLPGNSIYNMLHAATRASKFEYPSADIIINAGKHRYAEGEFGLWKGESDWGTRDSPYVTLFEVGTVKAGPDKYTIRGWSQGTMEWPMAVLYPDRKIVKRSKHLEDIKHWLGVT